MSIDRFLSKDYNKQTYNCAHLACDIWKLETGQDLSEFLQGFLTKEKNRTVSRQDLARFHRLTKPISPCIVLMNPAGKRSPHVGIFVRGRIVHITETGVVWQRLEMASLGFKTVRFYTCL